MAITEGFWLITASDAYIVTVVGMCVADVVLGTLFEVITCRRRRMDD